MKRQVHQRQRYYTTVQAAKLAGCCRATVVRAIRRGELKAAKRIATANAHYYISDIDLREWLDGAEYEPRELEPLPGLPLDYNVP